VPRHSRIRPLASERLPETSLGPRRALRERRARRRPSTPRAPQGPRAAPRSNASSSIFSTPPTEQCTRAHAHTTTRKGGEGRAVENSPRYYLFH
jgi:hypothetical protein